MNSYLLDTSFIIDYLRGKEQSVILFNKLEGEISSSYICLAELFEGVYRIKEQEKIKRTILEFFSGLNFIFGIDEKIAEKFGELRKKLKEKGEVIEDIDLFITATCVSNNLILVTHNKKHFSRIKELKIHSCKFIPVFAMSKSLEKKTLKSIKKHRKGKSKEIQV